jgi:hypothetical protein
LFILLAQKTPKKTNKTLTLPPLTPSPLSSTAFTTLCQPFLTHEQGGEQRLAKTPKTKPVSPQNKCAT